MLHLPTGRVTVFVPSDEPKTILFVSLVIVIVEFCMEANSAELVDKINDIISNDAAFSSIQGKIKFTVSSGRINIEGLTNEIRKIYFDNGQKNDTYKQLFVSTSTSVNAP